MSVERGTCRIPMTPIQNEMVVKKTLCHVQHNDSICIENDYTMYTYFEIIPHNLEMIPIFVENDFKLIPKYLENFQFFWK